MNKIQQYKEILEQAPEGATHVDFNSHYWHNSSAGYWLICDDGSRDCEDMIGNHIQRISDLQTIVDQAETIERLKDRLTYTSKELSILVEMYNMEVKDPCKYVDAETCYNNAKLLKELNND